MRISYCSSYVCSSDLALRESMSSMLRSIDVESQILDPVGLLKLIDDLTSPTTVSGEDVVDYNRFDPIADQAVRRDMEIEIGRDTSELQSLMRTSYAVFCLKNKTHIRLTINISDTYTKQELYKNNSCTYIS